MSTPKRILAGLFSLISASAVAQPSLSASTFTASVGESYTYTTVPFQSIASGTGGSNVVWDFSTLLPTGSEQVNFMNPGSGSYGSSFPAAGLLRKGSSGQESYYSMPNGSVEQMGIAFTGGVVASCSNPQRMMQFPFAFNQAFVDTFRCNFLSGVAGTRTGVDSVWADGWGTLVLPSETFTDVLRVRVKSRYNDTIVGQPVVIYTDDRTFFYKPGIHTSLLSTVDAVAEADGSVLATKQETHYYNVPVNITNLAGVKEAIRISPIPANNVLNVDIENPHDRAIKLELRNGMGQVVQQGTLEAGRLHTSIDCSSLARGIYFLQCADGGSRTVKKVLLQ